MVEQTGRGRNSILISYIQLLVILFTYKFVDNIVSGLQPVPQPVKYQCYFCDLEMLPMDVYIVCVGQTILWYYISILQIIILCFWDISSVLIV